MAERNIKSEKLDDSVVRHSHTFKVRFSPADDDEFNIHCDHPCTVLDAIKSTEKYKEKMMKLSDEQIIIQLGEADKEAAVATHFPCSCVTENQLLIMSWDKNKVQVVQEKRYQIHPQENRYQIHPQESYSVFYIDTKGGKQTKSKNLFINNIFKDFKYVCVYGENGTTVEEALRRDCRFINELNAFTLSDNENPKSKTERTQKVDKLNTKKYKLCLPQERKKTGTQLASKALEPSHVMTSPCVTEDPHSQPSCGKKPGSEGAQPGEAHLGPVVQRRQTVNIQEENQRLILQIPFLKRIMENRFIVTLCFNELKKLKKEEFGKIQASFSEVHRVKQLMELAESVCQLNVTTNFKSVCGTGFVLFDNIVLTNGHLFTMCKFQVDTYRELPEGSVTALFNYEEPTAADKWSKFNVTRILDFRHDELDYAVLELDMDKAQNKPPGLLKAFCSLPDNGEACIIGHPGGGVKKMDPTCIIGKQFREENVRKALHPFIAHKAINDLKEMGIASIMPGGSKVDQLGTYNSSMFLGSSGSPVFNGCGGVFGLHTGGFAHDKNNPSTSVIEYAQPLLIVFENFVKSLKEKRNDELLKRVHEEAKGNADLERICGLKYIKSGTDNAEPMEVD